MSQNQIEEVELSIAEARKMVDRGRTAERLAKNPEFKTLVLDGYFVEEAARLALLYSDPNLSPEIRDHVIRDLAGPGAFKRYLSTIVQFGQMAAREILEAEETLDELREEELFEEDDA